MTKDETIEPSLAESRDVPEGAIENGREFLRRIAEHYDFECEGGKLANCYEYTEAVRCFEHMASLLIALDAERGRLRTALKPFAERADLFEKEHSEREWPDGTMAIAPLGCFRRARSANCREGEEKMKESMMPTRSSMGCSLEAGQPDEPLKLDDEELKTIEHLALNDMMKRITKFEIKELVRVYRKALGSVPA